jgi:hypothetical protein
MQFVKVLFDFLTDYKNFFSNMVLTAYILDEEFTVKDCRVINYLNLIV